MVQVNVKLRFFKLNTISFLHFPLDVFKYYSTIMSFKKDQSIPYHYGNHISSVIQCQLKSIIRFDIHSIPIKKLLLIVSLSRITFTYYLKID